MVDSRLLADIFHDVDLAALRPANGINIFSQHPERRPHSLPRGQLDARLESPVRLREQTLRLQSRRRVVEFLAVRPGVRLPPRRDYQLPILNPRILRAIRVVLQLMIPPPAPANVVCPLRRIRQRAVLPIKLIAPHQGVALWRLRLLRLASLRKQTHGSKQTNVVARPSTRYLQLPMTNSIHPPSHV